MYISFASAIKVNKVEPILALKPRGKVTRNPKQGYQWSQKRTCVRQNLLKNNNRCISFPQKRLVSANFFKCHFSEELFKQLFTEIDANQDDKASKAEVKFYMVCCFFLHYYIDRRVKIQNELIS